jgi:hypothetical protein
VVCHNFETTCSPNAEPLGCIRLPTARARGGTVSIRFLFGVLHSFFVAHSGVVLIPHLLSAALGATVGVGGGTVEKGSFVVKEQKFIRPVRCIKCGGNAHLIRRSPDPVKEDGSEVRIFECHECGHQTLRIAKA